MTMTVEHREIEVDYLQNQLDSAKKQLEERAKELGLLYAENETLKDKVNFFNTKFDFTSALPNQILPQML